MRAETVKAAAALRLTGGGSTALSEQGSWTRLSLLTNDVSLEVRSRLGA